MKPTIDRPNFKGWFEERKDAEEYASYYHGLFVHHLTSLGRYCVCTDSVWQKIIDGSYII